MLEMLTGRGLSDVVAVVTRYFGGTLLGVGGLVRAYGDATALALDEAGTSERWRRELLDVTVPVGIIGQVEHRLREHWDVVDVDYGQQVRLRLAVAPSVVETATAEVAAVTSGRGTVTAAGDTWT